MFAKRRSRSIEFVDTLMWKFYRLGEIVLNDLLLGWRQLREIVRYDLVRLRWINLILCVVGVDLSMCVLWIWGSGDGLSEFEPWIDVHFDILNQQSAGL